MEPCKGASECSQCCLEVLETSGRLQASCEQVHKRQHQLFTFLATPIYYLKIAVPYWPKELKDTYDSSQMSMIQPIHND